ncbi:MAG: ComEC/Rec2 family competence protein [Chloracidobacterium sp.]|nr:ComEC/Rec2 family competence protein [Chloracidobacterium sp.]
MSDTADTPRPFNREPLVAIAAAFAAGIVAAKFTSAGVSVSLVVTLILGLTGFATRKHAISTAFVLLAFVAAGAFSFEIEQKRDKAADRIRTIYDSGQIASGMPVEVEGVLARQPEATLDGRFLTLQSERLVYRGAERAVTGAVRVFVHIDSDISDLRSKISNLKYGSRVRVACALAREEQYQNPGVISRIELLDRMGVDASCSVKSPLLIEHLADESVFLPIAWVYEQRSRLIDEFRQSLSPKASGVMIASLLGNKHFLDKDTAELFREGGTFHILVISGLHITFIGGILLLVVRRLTRKRWVQFVVTSSALWAYTLAVGADIPVVRAAVMFTVLLLGYAIYRSGTLLNSLALSALLLLIWRPSDLFDASLQLTVVSVAAIVACAYPLIEHLRAIGEWTPSHTTPFPPNVSPWLKRVCETLYWNADAWAVNARRQIWTAGVPKSPLLRRTGNVIQKAVRYLLEGLLVSLIVQLWMLPLTVVYFHRVPLVSVVLNLWVGFFIAVESFAAVAAALAAKGSEFLAASLFLLADAMNWLMLALPRAVSSFEWMSFRLPAYSGPGISLYFLYLVPMLLMAVAVRRWRPFDLKRTVLLWNRGLTTVTISLGVLLAVIVVVHPFSASRPDGRLHMDFLDVGQGDAVLITFPTGETMLVDGGGQIKYKRSDDQTVEPFEADVRGIGEAVVSEFLWSKGISRLDYIVATHADADHVQGLADVVKNFRVGRALFGRMPEGDPDLSGLYAALEGRGVLAQVVARGDVLRIGEVNIEVIHPLATIEPDAPSTNNESVVLRIVFGERAFLLTGDIELAAEQDIVDSNRPIKADVVKIAHHGSRTSSIPPFVRAANAEVGIISVGRRSQFDHPHPEVVERWQGAGAIVLTTGTSGMISISTDGRDLTADLETK